MEEITIVAQVITTVKVLMEIYKLMKEIKNERKSTTRPHR